MDEIRTENDINKLLDNIHSKITKQTKNYYTFAKIEEKANNITEKEIDKFLTKDDLKLESLLEIFKIKNIDLTQKQDVLKMYETVKDKLFLAVQNEISLSKILDENIKRRDKEKQTDENEEEEP